MNCILDFKKDKFKCKTAKLIGKTAKSKNMYITAKCFCKHRNFKGKTKNPTVNLQMFL